MFTSSSEDSCNTDTEDDDLIVTSASCTYKRKPARIQQYVEFVVPNYLDNEFRQHFRLTRGAFDYVLEAIRPHIKEECQISMEKQLMAIVWLLANQETYRYIFEIILK